MYKIAKFEKVGFGEFNKAIASFFNDNKSYIQNENDADQIYKALKLPVRATKGSAGYDFFSTVSISLPAKKSLTIPTGIRVKIQDGWFLSVYPRSSLGFKYRLQLDNTVGIIDSDYYNSDNEGHIFIKITNDSNNSDILSFYEGDRFVQGIFLPYGITADDDVFTSRTGGIGSTN